MRTREVWTLWRWEEADREHIDQRRLQRELGQMHMKQMLIEDKKDIRLLQEMLLEDGELHIQKEEGRDCSDGPTTVIFGEEDNKAQIHSDDDNADEDEDEESWRRSRHEREQYLKEHKRESDSQLLKLGQKALKRMSSSSQETKLTPTVDPLASPNPKKPFQQLLKRGSFLTRGEQVLSRLAQMVASSDATTNVNQPKNSRNFVFASISPTKDKGEEPKPIQ
ncbi:claspin-like, partial [Homalodisca vitripennis]|uniref:claspin-like n=1 Tax=Homalodisca vitripennis TaxID=197043 RepID=UPI001EEBA891